MRYQLVKSPIRSAYKIVNIDTSQEVQLCTIFTDINELEQLFKQLIGYEKSLYWYAHTVVPRSDLIIAEADTLEDLKQKVPYLFL